MTRQQKISLLTKWSTMFNCIEDEYDKLKNMFDASPDCPVVKTMYDCFSEFTKVLSDLLGDEDDWLDWYIWGNYNGKNKLKAKAASWAKEKPIENIVELLELIEDSQLTAEK